MARIYGDGPVKDAYTEIDDYLVITLTALNKDIRADERQKILTHFESRLQNLVRNFGEPYSTKAEDINYDNHVLTIGTMRNVLRSVLGIE